MKRIAFSLFALCLGFTMLMAQNGAPAAKFDKTEHDFGKVKESAGTVSTVFTLTNVGNAPLILNRVQSSCGCATPEWTQAPIKPGEKGTIKVTYDTKGRVYTFNRKITVFTNVPDQVYTLTIKGEVIN